MTREKDLTGQGCERQATYDEPRLAEMVDAYRDIGLEAHLAPFYRDEAPGCAACMASMPDRYKSIYTRKKPDSLSP
ncbi:MAG: hypothetical protein R3274_00405 [Desulfobacterales bacterium]|nr:hypothetical protein [Desulfobacterales bacterium]